MNGLNMADMHKREGPFRPHMLIPYALALVAVGVTYAARFPLDNWLDERAQFLVFTLPILFSALFLGRGPAVLAALLSLAGGLSLMRPGAMAAPAAQAQLVVFLLVCIGIIWLARRLAAERARSEALGAEARNEAARAHEAGEELRLLLAGAADYAIFLVDPAGLVVTWNKGAERLFGWTEDEILGRHCSVFYTGDGNTTARADGDLESAIRTGHFATEAWHVRKDGSEFLAQATITPVQNAEGEIRGFAKVIHDVSERRASERALERRERHLRSILATVPDAMVVIDERGLIVSFSAAAEELFGYIERDVLGRNVSMLMPSPDRERHDSYLQRYLETGKAHIIGIGRIVTGLRANGTTFPMKLAVGEAISEDQRLFTGFVHDLTERRDFEAKLEEVRSELIHVSRLSAMGTMASTLAHELNQPLTAIATYSQTTGDILNDPGEPDKAILKEVFEELAAQSMRAGAIVRRLRDFVARGEVSKSVEDLPGLINEAGALALIGSKEKGISSEFLYGADASPALVDRVQVQQVLINLIRNAIEAMDGSPVRKLTVSTRLLDPQTIQVSVADTGPGIAAEMRERLFDAFASTKSEGMGLGLSICRTIIEAHDGRIRAVPREGGGTEFQLTLPRATETE